MQNFDYSKHIQKPKFMENGNLSSKNQYLNNGNNNLSLSKSVLWNFAGGILIFTAGFIMGVKMGEGENKSQVSEQNPRNYKDQIANKMNHPVTPEEKEQQVIQFKNTSEPNSNAAIINPTTLKNPKQAGATNYIIKIDVHSRDQIQELGNDLINNNKSLEGLLFRSTKGDLYLGYFYTKNDASQFLDLINNLHDSRIQNLQIQSFHH